MFDDPNRANSMVPEGDMDRSMFDDFVSACREYINSISSTHLYINLDAQYRFRYARRRCARKFLS